MVMLLWKKIRQKKMEKYCRGLAEMSVPGESGISGCLCIARRFRIIARVLGFILMPCRVTERAT